MSQTPDIIRRAVRAHLIATAGVLLAVLGAMLVVEVLLTSQQANRLAAAASTRVANALMQTLRAIDFADDELDASTLDGALRGFFDSGTVERVKVWRVEGEHVRVVYSDARQLVGEVRDFSPELAARLDAGEVVILPVPDDYEHRLETSLDLDLREAFIGFTDATGHHMRLEVYVPVFTRQMIAGAFSLQAPVIVGGLVALLAVLVPMTVRLTRRLRLLDAEHARMVSFGEHAREQERADLARRLHDDVIQSLSGARLALSTVAARESGLQAALDRVGDVLAASTQTLRGMLTEFLPSTVTGASVDHDLAQLVAGVDHESTALVTYRSSAAQSMRIDDTVAAAIYTAAQEGLRNAIKHAHATTIEVSLTEDDGVVRVTVTDDGVGITTPASHDASMGGHVGLMLARRALETVGGSVSVSSTPGIPSSPRGTVFVASAPARSDTSTR